MKFYFFDILIAVLKLLDASNILSLSNYWSQSLNAKAYKNLFFEHEMLQSWLLTAPGTKLVKRGSRGKPQKI